MPTSLEFLLRTMHSAPSFGSAIDLSTEEMDGYLQRMEATRHYFVEKMEPLVTAGIPDWEVSERAAFASAERWVAFSPGLAADMTPKVKRFGDMAVLTGLTAVVNGLLDRDDRAMPLAIRKFQGARRRISPELKQTVRARSSLLSAITGKLFAVAHPGDVRTLYRIIGKDLYRDGKRIHELSVLYAEAADKDAFMTENAQHVTRLMIDTGAIQSVTAPLFSMLRRNDKTLLSLKEVHGSEYVTRLLKLGNAVIRVQDDAGDRERDSDPSKFSINLFNQPTEPLIRAFCHEVELDVERTEMVVESFPAASTPEKRHDLVTVFIDHFQRNFGDVPEKYGLYTKLVRRALAAGEANEVGDDELARRAQTE